MKIIINADDFANSLYMSEIIVRCFRDGILNSTSIMVNSADLDASLKLLDNLNIRTSLHFNIAEGTSVTPFEELHYLTENSIFCRSFEEIVVHYYFGSRDKKELIKNDIKRELKNQILLYAKKLHIQDVNIDSHQHYHTIPFIVDILLELREELHLNISYVRVPKEPFFIDVSALQNIKNYLGLNIIKHILLNFFSKSMMQKLKRDNIECNDAFIGVLFTGNVTLNSIKKAMQKIKDAKIIEILLHPGYLSPQENRVRKDDKFKRFYTDKGRLNEMQVLLLPEFRDYMNRVNKI